MFVSSGVLEKSACLLLSEKGVPADERRQFEEILAAMESADEKTLPALDRDFHTMLLRATGNSLMVTVLDAIAEVYQKWIDIVIRKTGKDEKNRLQAYHKGIYTSLSEADTDLALRFVDDHYDLIEEMLEL